MEKKLRITKKKHKGVFAQNCISVQIDEPISEQVHDEIIDVFDEHYRELVPMVTQSNLRKAYRTGEPVDVDAMGITPDKLRHDGFVAFSDGNYFRLTFCGPAYSVNSETQDKIVQRMSELTGKKVKLVEGSSDAWYD